MKMRSILASVAACAVAASAMAVSAFAAITNENGDGNYMVSIKEDYDATAAYGMSFTIKMADGWNESGAGGGVIFNGSEGWNQAEWGISGEGEDCKNVDGVTISGSDGTFTITRMSSSPVFAAADEGEEGWAQIVCSSWWGADFEVVSMTALDASGNALATDGGAAAEETTAAPAEESTTAAADDTAAATTTAAAAEAAKTTTAAAATTTSSSTGDAGVGMAVAGLSLAAAVAFVAKKKN